MDIFREIQAPSRLMGQTGGYDSFHYPISIASLEIAFLRTLFPQNITHGLCTWQPAVQRDQEKLLANPNQITMHMYIMVFLAQPVCIWELHLFQIISSCVASGNQQTHWWQQGLWMRFPRFFGGQWFWIMICSVRTLSSTWKPREVSWHKWS